MTRKTTKHDGFLYVLWSFCGLGPILAHQTAKFKLSGQCPFSWHPWGPWGCLSSGVICIWKIYQLFCDNGTALVDFFTLMKMLPYVNFISTVIKKSVYVSINSHNFKFSTEMQSLKPWLWNIWVPRIRP